jgi:hypothetical protein
MKQNCIYYNECRLPVQLCNSKCKREFILHNPEQYDEKKHRIFLTQDDIIKLQKEI